MDDRKIKRRKFMATGAATAAAIAGTSLVTQNCAAVPPESTASEKDQQNPDLASNLPLTEMPERILGKTGVSVPIFGLGGAGQTPLSQRGREKESILLLEKAVELGIRYFDTAASYGPSEDNFGQVLPAYRSRVFIASKTSKLDRDGAWRELERSLERLKTDYLDLWQLHHISFLEEIDKITAKNGAGKALQEAKEQKIVRFCGITGHHEPDAIAEGVRRYPFDTILVPINAADRQHPHPFVPHILPVAQAENIGVIAMKVPAYGRIFKPGRLTGMEQAFGYSLSQPGVHCAIVAAEDTVQLESNINVAKAFQQLEQSQLKEIETLAANGWEDTTFFRRWT
ncbi:MAG: aldo/keto reductase [Cyanobacteria bacterium SBLK]|nr:aldo/keto reductase [Cyanobacteria bacterium SBLK]